MAACSPLTAWGSEAGAMAHVAERARVMGPIANAIAVHWIMLPAFEGERVEHAWVLVLDAWARLLRAREINVGERHAVLVPLDLAVRAARCAHSRYFVVAHNHPGGFAWPSEDDAEVTRIGHLAARENGLVMLDHVVLAVRELYSFREGTLWNIRS